MSASSRRRAPTLRDVAERAGVDPSLVSRLVNQSQDLHITDATRQRVLAAIEEVGYQPNLTARGLRLQRTFTVGFLLPELENPVYAPIVRGAERQAQRIGYGIVLGGAIGDAEAEQSFVRLVDEGRVDGLLIASTTLSDGFLDRRVRGDAPVVIVNRQVDGIASCAVVDDSAGSSFATEHLIGLGHRALGLLTGPATVDTSIRRRHGFLEAVEAGGVEVVAEQEAESFAASAGYDAAHRLLDRARPTALFVATLTLAFGVLKAARERSVEVPDDLSVIALHDAEMADYTVPPLTTVALPLETLGERSVQMLQTRIEGRDVVPVIVDEPGPRLVARASTRPR